MARDHTKDTDNRVALGTGDVAAQLDGAEQISVHVWVYFDTLSEADDGERFLEIVKSTTDNGLCLRLAMNGGVPVVCLDADPANTGVTDSQTLEGTTEITTGTWHSIGAVVDFDGDSMRLYLNGALEASSAKAFTNTSFTDGNDQTREDRIGSTSE